MKSSYFTARAIEQRNLDGFLTAIPRRSAAYGSYDFARSGEAEAGRAEGSRAIRNERWIVVGTDFSDGADSALAQAIDLAATSNANIALVHAYEDPPGVVPTSDRSVDEVQSRLHEAVAGSSAQERGIRVEPVIRRGAPWEKIVNAASDLGATLIVVGAHGARGPMRGSLVGSVAMRVVANSTQSVLVVRPGRSLPLTEF